MFVRRALGIGAAALLFGLMLAMAAHAQSADEAIKLKLAEAVKLNAEVIRLFQAGKSAEAIPLAKRALAIREEALGAEHPSVGQVLSNLAGLYESLGHYREAEPLYKRSFEILDKAPPFARPYAATTLNNLAGLYHRQGRYDEAEALYKRALNILDKTLGPDHPSVATTLNNLAGLYHSQARYAEAEPLYRRTVTVLEKALGPDQPQVAIALNNLGELEREQGRYREAEPLFKRSLAILEKTLGPEHSNVAISVNNLAELARLEGHAGQAEQLYKRSLGMLEKSFGPDHPTVATSLTNLGALYRTQGRYAEAEPLFKRALKAREKTLGPEHPDVAFSLDNLAMLALGKRDFAGAVTSWRRSTAIIKRRAGRGTVGATKNASSGEVRQDRTYFEGLVKATWRLAETRPTEEPQLAAETFETAQWGHDSGAAASLAQMAARSAAGSPRLAALVRERQDLVAEWQRKDKLLVTARSLPREKRNAAGEDGLGKRLSAIDTRLTEIDRQLATDFPAYARLASPRPIQVSDVQAVLGRDEALVLFLDTGATFAPLPEETFVWIVTKTKVRWLRSAVGTRGLANAVGALRCGLDRTAWYGDGALRCADLLKLPLDKAPADDALLPFDLSRAYALYESLLGDAADLLRGKQLLIVPSGALTRLPFQVLVTATPSKQAALKDVQWLARSHAITVLPSVASLAALRRVARPSRADRPMIGFGNPLLDGPDADYAARARAARNYTACRQTPIGRLASLFDVRGGGPTITTHGGLADVALLKHQIPLPETADELCAVARDLGANLRDVHLGARAMEREIKRLSTSGRLARYRIVHFATHGTLAGELSGTIEPGLILTPPQTPSAEDDGYLSGSEIASLKLDADWVILSACNTAGGSSPGAAAEALSGLARVFFYAGARALLVSHWEVDSDATVKLITSAAGAISKHKGIGRAEALRQAMLALIGSDVPRAAHPAYWAPFVVVGEGGSR